MPRHAVCSHIWQALHCSISWASSYDVLQMQRVMALKAPLRLRDLVGLRNGTIGAVSMAKLTLRELRCRLDVRGGCA